MTFLAMNVVELGLPFAMEKMRNWQSNTQEQKNSDHEFVALHVGKEGLENIMWD